MCCPDLPYSVTSNFAESTLHEAMLDISGEEDNFVEVNGPSGFGLATGLRAERDQCLKRYLDFLPSTTCLHTPDHESCKDGLSFSLWERTFLGEIDLTYVGEEPTWDSSQFRYIVSTGGDAAGHPGVALVHENAWLLGIVTTKTHSWKTWVFGMTMDNQWNNIGVTWNEDDGIKIYINATLAAHTKFAIPIESLPPVDPSELMIGCNKDQDNKEYIGFLNSDIDEFAFWNRSLNTSQTRMMLGGYSESNEYTAGKVLDFINKVDLTDPDQQQGMMSMLSKIVAPTNSKPAPEPKPSTNNSIAIVLPISKDLDNLQNGGLILMTMLKPSKLPQELSEELGEQYMGLSNSLSDILNIRNKQKWLAVHSKTDEVGAMQLVAQFSRFTGELLKRSNFLATAKPSCKRISLKSFINDRCVMYADQFRGKAIRVMLPDTPSKFAAIKDKKTAERIIVPSGIMPDEFCTNGTLSYSLTTHDSAAEFAHVVVNQVAIPRGPEYVINSKIISLNLNFHEAQNRLREFQEIFAIPKCSFNLDYLKKSPVRFSLKHTPPLDVVTRRCVWWNEDLSDFGAWDSTGCNAYKAMVSYTVCVCNRLETFAILAEKVPKKIVPAEPLWVTIMKYSFHALSIACIFLYMVFVIASEDLKDQFHIMGLNLAIAILGGAVALLLSDLDMIQKDPLGCIAVGSLIHFFYGAAGFWMLGMAQACFAAITSGIIGGRLKAYMFMCWGSALTMAGVPFVWYLEEMGTDPRCFIGWSNQVKMLFFGPQILCAGFAMFTGNVIFCNLSTTTLRKETLIDDYGSFCRGAALLLLLLSTTWFFGLLAYVRFGFTDPDFNPIFQVLNSIAGVSLFVFIGLGSNRFKMFVVGQAKMRKKMVRTHAFGLPTLRKKTKRAHP